MEAGGCHVLHQSLVLMSRPALVCGVDASQGSACRRHSALNPCTSFPLQGMLYLHGHKPPIIHRDLKSPNLLVEKNWRVKVRPLYLFQGLFARLLPAVGPHFISSTQQLLNPFIICWDCCLVYNARVRL